MSRVSRWLLLATMVAGLAGIVWVIVGGRADRPASVAPATFVKTPPSVPSAVPAGTPEPSPVEVPHEDTIAEWFQEQGMPATPAEAVEEIRRLALEEYGEVLRKIAEENQRTNVDDALADRADALRELCQRASEIIDQVRVWTRNLVRVGAFEQVDAFADILRASLYFKEDAALYLAVSRSDAAVTVLLDAGMGQDLYARYAALNAVTPYALEMADLPDAFRKMYYKTLSDDFSWVKEDGKQYGANLQTAVMMARAMRGTAVAVLVHLDDAGALNLLVDTELGNDGVGWSYSKEVNLYGYIARHGAPDRPPRLTDRLKEVIDRRITWDKNPGHEWPGGSAIEAAWVLETFGVSSELDRLRNLYYREFSDRLQRGEIPWEQAGSLFALRDTRVTDVVLDWLEAPSTKVRHDALAVLIRATGQRMGDAGGLDGDDGEARVRLAQVKHEWKSWWAQHGAEFARTNPFAPSAK